MKLVFSFQNVNEASLIKQTKYTLFSLRITQYFTTLNLYISDIYLWL